MRTPRAAATALVLIGALALSTRSGAQGRAQAAYQPPQPPPQGSGRISGRVVAADSGESVPNATVSADLSIVGGGSSLLRRTTATDADGRWELVALPEGSYSIAVTKAGYLTALWGQLRPFAFPTKLLPLAARQAVANITLSLIRTGVIAGSVFDDRGEPATGAAVVANRSMYIDNERRLEPANRNGLSESRVDDRGQFRIYGLPPGEYYVSASHGLLDARQDGTSFAPTFFPGTAEQTAAAAIKVEAGRDTTVTFNMARVRVVKVSGRVVDAQARPLAGGYAGLQSPSARADRYTEPRTVVRADGTFEFQSVPPGSYVLRVGTPYSPGVVQQTAAMPLVVDGNDVEGLSLEVARHLTASGRVVTDDGSAVPTGVGVGAYPVTPETAIVSYSGVRSEADGTFVFRNLFGRQFFRVTFPLTAQWFLKSVSIGGRDVTDTDYDFDGDRDITGIEAVLTQRMASLVGTAQDERGSPIADYSVVAFPTDERKWTFRSRFVRRVDSIEDGRFVLKGLPAGEYFVIVLPLLEPGQETDPAQLAQWRARAVRTTVADQEAKPMILRLAK